MRTRHICSTTSLYSWLRCQSLRLFVYFGKVGISVRLDAYYSLICHWAPPPSMTVRAG